MTVTLCVLLWPRRGRAAELVDYEDRVLRLLPDHGARVVQRARTAGDPSEPLEVHVLEFPSQQALDDYMGDERRTALAGARDLAVERTQVLRVDLV
jgi:uncharacterized protein (DUF1330 family)